MKTQDELARKLRAKILIARKYQRTIALLCAFASTDPQDAILAEVL